MRIEQVQIDVQNLKKGMYVCGLDRPWITTPFPFQGFVVRGPRDIEELKAHCQFVYVDVNRGVAPSTEDFGPKVNWGGRKKVTQAAPEPVRAKRIEVRHDYYKAPKAFNREIRRAHVVHQELTRAVAAVIDDLRVGRALDVMAARTAASKMIQSVIRNPNAFVWLLKLRDKDKYSYAHSVRSTVLAIVLGRHIGLNEKSLEDLALGTMLCDIGKAKLTKGLLEKRDPLTEEERAKVESHVAIAVRMLEGQKAIPERVRRIVETHHERYDGSGYPRGLQGDQIPLLGRIAGLVDAYDAMISVKPYTDKLMTPTEATEYLYERRDVLFQGQLVQEFIRAVGIYPAGTLVRLSNGEMAMVLSNTEHRLYPKALVLVASDGEALAEPRPVDLCTTDRKGNVNTYASIEAALVPEDYGLDVRKIMEQYEEQQWSLDKIKRLLRGAA
ncbi:MAG: HD family phosphohydrolase [Lysobacteraceae bacterium]|nr:MAG: HD family phosphohydrolase [Xanthomonadaceae bacterium]